MGILWRVIWREAPLPIKAFKIRRPRPKVRLTRACRAGPKLKLPRLSRVNAVFANDVRELRQEFPEPGVFFDQRVGFVGRFVAAKGGPIPLQGVLKQ
jgi:hypothetical protein